MIGEPDAGKPPVRFDEGVQETCGIVTRLCPTLRTLPPWGKIFWHSYRKAASSCSRQVAGGEIIGGAGNLR